MLGRTAKVAKMAPSDNDTPHSDTWPSSNTESSSATESSSSPSVPIAANKRPFSTLDRSPGNSSPSNEFSRLHTFSPRKDLEKEGYGDRHQSEDRLDDHDMQEVEDVIDSPPMEAQAVNPIEERFGLVGQPPVLEAGVQYVLAPESWWKEFAEGYNPGIVDVTLVDPSDPQEFVPLHKEQWDQVKQWFGANGPPVKRRAIEAEDGSIALDRNGIMINIHLLGGSPHNFSLHQYWAPYDELISGLVQDIESDFDIKISAPIRLWILKGAENARLSFQLTADQFHAYDHSPLDLNSDKTLRQLGLENNTHVVVEIQEHAGWISDSKPLRGIVGLNNLGNTCYMNSALQCLLHVEELACYFLSGEYSKDINEDNPIGYHGNVARAFGSLMDRLVSSSSSAFAPRAFKSVIGRYRSAFAGYMQQDSQEFLAFLLDSLHEDLNKIRNKPATEKPELPDDKVNDPEAVSKLADEVWALHKKRNDSVVLDLFAGLYRSVLVCPVCSKVSITFDPFMDLTLPLPVESAWIMDLTVVPKNGCAIGYTVVMDKFSSVGQLKQYLGDRLGVNPRALISTEIYNGRFFRQHGDEDMVSDKMGEGDIIYIYETDQEQDEEHAENPVITVPVYHRISTSAGTTASVPNRFDRGGKYFGVPFFITLTEEESKDADTIANKISEKYAALSEYQETDQRPFELNYVEHHRPRYGNYGGGNLSSMSFRGGDVKPFANRLPREPEVQPASPTEDKEISDTENPADAGKEEDAMSVGEDSASKEDNEHDTQSANASQSESSPNELEDDHMKDESGDESDASSAMGIAPLLQSTTSLDAMSPVDADSRSVQMAEQDDDPRLVRSDESIVCDWTHETIDLVLGGSDKMDKHETKENSDLVEHQQKVEAKRRQGIDLADCLDLFSKPEVLSPDDLWYCSRCKDFRQATKTIDLWRVPDVFTIHLKRFSSFRNFRDKIDEVVNFPIEGLDMSGRIHDTKMVESLTIEEHGLIYDLFAVDNHYGGLGGGHYTAYVKNFADNEWYYFDDSSVRKTNPENAITGAAYLLFYRRRSSKPLGGERIQEMVESMRNRNYTPVPVSNESSFPESHDGSTGGAGFYGVGRTLRSQHSDPMPAQLPWGNAATLNLGGDDDDDESKSDSDSSARVTRDASDDEDYQQSEDDTMLE